MNPRRTRECFPRLREQIGEDPARFLDRPLLEHYDGDADTSTAGKFIQTRIRGIDRLDVLNAWVAVERRLDRGPRDRVLDLLEQRRDALQEYGERSDISLDDVDPIPSQSAEADVFSWRDRDGGKRTAVWTRDRIFGGPSGKDVAADGGEQR